MVRVLVCGGGCLGMCVRLAAALLIVRCSLGFAMAWACNFILSVACASICSGNDMRLLILTVVGMWSNGVPIFSFVEKLLSARSL